LPGTRALRREEIKLQVALVAPLIHVKGFAASRPTGIRSCRPCGSLANSTRSPRTAPRSTSYWRGSRLS
jgi:hypothetical protein